MLNQIVIVGRLVADPAIIEENDKKTSTITLAVPRSYKNTDGEYDTDFINCRLWDNIADNAVEYCRKGDLIGVKGRVENTDQENTKSIEIVAEKITFLSSNSKDKE